MNINELIFDKKNYNKGTEQGDKLLEKSITKFGFRQAAIVDKNGNIVAGNKRIAKAGELGIEDVNIIKGDPNKITVIQYDDFDLENDKKTKEYALADNQVSKINIELDTDLVMDDLGIDIMGDWQLDIIGTIDKDYSSSNGEVDIQDNNSLGIISFTYSNTEYLRLLDLLNNAQEKLECNSKEEVLAKLLAIYV